MRIRSKGVACLDEAEMIVRRNSEDPEACANCGHEIGRLETPMVWNHHVVCQSCYARISSSTNLQSTARPPTIRGCPVCGSVKQPKKKRYGSVMVGLALVGFGIWDATQFSAGDGPLGLIICAGGIALAVGGMFHWWICPDCRTKLGNIG
jgi:hypothetical protein